VKKRSKLGYAHGRLLYSVLRKYIADNSPAYVNVLETGTARGFSALCMAKAIADSGVTGHVVTNRPAPAPDADLLELHR
jgi:predicted O-methyltransferase YrrM